MPYNLSINHFLKHLTFAILCAISSLWILENTFNLASLRSASQQRHINNPAVQAAENDEDHHHDDYYEEEFTTVIMPELKVGDSFPEGITFTYIPYTPANGDIKSCGIPIQYNASKEWANKKVVVFSVPGAFTPSCSASHLPGYIEKLPELKKKGVDVVATIAYNDAWVMSAWGKANGVKDDSILFLTDDGAKFSTSIGWNAGERTARYAFVLDHGKVIYAEKEPGRDVSVSSAEAVLAKI